MCPSAVVNKIDTISMQDLCSYAIKQRQFKKQELHFSVDCYHHACTNIQVVCTLVDKSGLTHP